METHIFDYEGDLYGACLRVHLIEHLRPERKFSGLDQLKAQIVEDAEKARKVLQGLQPLPGRRRRLVLTTLFDYGVV